MFWLILVDSRLWLLHVTWIVCEMGGKLSYNCCFFLAGGRYCFQNFKVYFFKKCNVSLNLLARVYVFIYRIYVCREKNHGK